MASYTRAQVQDMLPVKDMVETFNRKRGTKSKFFDAVPNADGNNLAYQFSRLADGRQDVLPTGSATLEGIRDTWLEFVKTGTLPGLKPTNGNTGGGDDKKDNGGQQPTGTQQRRAAEAAEVPPVTPNIFESAVRALDAVRKDEVAPPANADEAYNLLWDNLDPIVRQARASGVISSALGRLAKENTDLFNGIITILPEEVRSAILDALEARALDVVNASLKTTVEDVFHISKGARHAERYFQRWDDQSKQALEYATRNEEWNYVPTPEQVNDANKDTAVAAFRSLVRGLDTEVKASKQTTTTSEEMKPILFETVVTRLSPEQLAAVAGQWGSMTPAQQHAFVSDLDREAAAAEQPTTEPPAETVATSEVAPAAEEETPAEEEKPQGRGNRRQS
jgi:hypothetical protein